MNNKRHYHSGNSKCFRKCVLEMGTETKHIYIYIYKNEEVAQSCLTLCQPMDYTVHGVFQARILEWVSFPFARGSSQPRDWTLVSYMAGGFFTNWTIREACVCVCGCVYYIPKVEFVRLDVVVNYTLALAVGTCYLPWQGLNEVLHSCWFSIPLKGFKVESRNEVLCALGKKKKQLAEQVFR